MKTTTPPETLNGRDFLRANGLPVEGPILWGRSAAGSGPGVFVVELPAPQPLVSIDPEAIRQWLARAPELRLDGKRPSVGELQSRLASFWLPGQVILYIGSSEKSVGARLAGIYKTPLGERRPQPAGYWLKTLHDLARTRIWWAPVSDPALYEDTLLDNFVKAVGALPYAVLATPSGERREHGITSPLHDDQPPAPVKPAKVRVLPDAGADEMAMSEGTATRRNPAARPATRKAPARTARKASMPIVGPSAIVTPVVRRTGKRAGSGTGGASAIEPTHLTAEGLAALESELEELTTLRRPEVIGRIKAARELGDLSENADYEAARKEQSFLEGRILQLQQMIKHASIIDTTAERGNGVILGSTVTVETDRHGQETFTIVGSAEADAAAGKISFTSPIGRALMGRRSGETVRIHVPAGTLDYKIVTVK